MSASKKFLTAMVVVVLVIGVHAETAYFVWRGNPEPVFPYTNWNTAATAIQDAVDLAAAGDTVYVTNGVYDTGGRPFPPFALTNRVYVTKAINIISMNGPETTIIKGAADPDDANGFGPAAVRCAYLENATLIGFTLTNGHTMVLGNNVYEQNGGGAVLRDTSVSNCVVVGNRSTNRGGGCYVYLSGTLSDSRISGNTAFDSGGGVDAYNTSSGQSETIYRNCMFSDNWASSGGGVSFSGIGLLDGCTIANNTATDSGGGGLRLQGQLLNSTVEGNTCGSKGGSGGAGVYLLASSSVMSNCVVRNNSLIGTGGGIYIYGGSVMDCVISNNTATHGAGARVRKGSLSYSVLSGNQATSRGGGIYQETEGSTTDCLISNNVAATYGGGAWPVGGVIDRCAFVSNQALSRGGAVNYEGSNNGVIQNSLMIWNQSDRGGAIWFTGHSPGVVTNCTIAYNSANSLGGGIYAESTNAILHNTIIWGNIRASNDSIENLLVVNDASPRFSYSCCAPLQPGDGNVDVNPRFIDPGFGDFRLKLPSPCADRGLTADWMGTALDIEGNPRVMGPDVDLGAYEAGPLPLGTLIICL